MVVREENGHGAELASGDDVYERAPYDYVLVGGGLQNGLIALALLAARSEVRIALVERSAALGGNHTWCFHAADVPEDAAGFVDPLVAQRWSGYRVAFPAHVRTLQSPYAAVTSERLDRVLRERFAQNGRSRLLLGCEAKQIGEREVRLADGRTLHGHVVVDARGPEQGVGAARSGGYQKFVGLELQLRDAHGLHSPMLMDATIPQRDGFRFMYVLPLAKDRLLVEDTYVSDTARLDRREVASEALRYAEAHGWRSEAIVREEAGVLPLPLAGTHAASLCGPLVAGYQGGWFHPVTGYSFPLALRLARLVAREAPDALFGAELAALVQQLRVQRAHCYRLNRMFFQWYPPAQRYHVLERFYRLPEPTIRRFYAMELSRGDRARILLGRPPRGLSLRRALGWNRNSQ